MNLTTAKLVDIALARANWWIHFATTTKNKTRTVYHQDGAGNKTYLTPDQLVDDAFETANRHIQNAQELIDSSYSKKEEGE